MVRDRQRQKAGKRDEERGREPMWKRGEERGKGSHLTIKTVLKMVQIFHKESWSYLIHWKLTIPTGEEVKTRGKYKQRKINRLL